MVTSRIATIRMMTEFDPIWSTAAATSPSDPPNRPENSSANTYTLVDSTTSSHPMAVRTHVVRTVRSLRISATTNPLMRYPHQP